MPVDFSLLSRSHGFNPRGWLRGNWDCPVWVDNDVHLMALNAWTTLSRNRGTCETSKWRTR